MARAASDGRARRLAPGRRAFPACASSSRNFVASRRTRFARDDASCTTRACGSRKSALPRDSASLRGARHANLCTHRPRSRAFRPPSLPPRTDRDSLPLSLPVPALTGSRSGGTMLHTTHALAAVRRRLRRAVRTVAPSATLLALLGSAAHAQTYYVNGSSGTCSNTGAGTQTQPYCTIGAAMAAHNGPGVTIIVMPGTYREQITVPASGAAGSPFVFQASGPGVVIDGSDDFSNTALWVSAGGGTYLAATATWTVKQVFVDGARIVASTNTPATMPANSFQFVAGTGLYVNVGGANPGTHQTLVGHR